MNFASALLSEGLAPPTLDHIRQLLGAKPRAALPSLLPAASVLIPLCEIEGRASLLFTKRSERVGSHRGQVSFPGGKADRGDRGPVDTALRETHEELGLEPEAISILGLGDDMLSITGLRVTPVVGFVERDVDRAFSSFAPAEIDAVFALSFAELTDPTKRDYRRVEGPRNFPVFDAGPWPVWGLTAMLTERFLVSLGFPPSEPRRHASTRN